MGSLLSVIKTLVIPAVISLILFVVSTYVVVPLWQRYRSRYSQYLPLNSISTGTSSIRARLAGTLNPWRTRLHNRLVVASAGDEGSGYNSEEGEELNEVDDADIVAHRGAESERGGWSETGDQDRRLSRDLEEGFRDSSDDEQETFGRAKP
ncbi:hypothetical protein P8C59_004153 [Phyllachora maydis]|uniref:Uncharacterized protein n=1 Tax=Phyllachora maydis TaxID=1825666 RepID=A0AAD9I1T9_9PEZI|nr:hypothetical protein P8C59_004153 [Phyllachora maydis]